MKRQYKDSGIPWIGMIPSDWEVEPIGRNIHEVDNPNVGGTETNALQFKAGTIISKSVGDSKYHPTTLEAYNVVDEGVIMLNGLNLSFDLISQRVGLVQEKGVITSAYLAIKPSEQIKSEFLTYLFKAYDARKALHAMGKGLRQTLAWKELKCYSVVYPPLPTQQRIADFLDSKCAEIDELAALQQTMIAELKRYKQSVITEAVTKGLDPDVPMQDSGVEWIGKIPEGWEVKRLKFVANRRNEKADDTTLKYIGLEHIVGFSKEMVETENVYDNEGANMCYDRDVIFGKLRPYLGKAKVIEDTCCCSSEFLVLCNVHCPDYLRYLMLSGWFIEIVNASTYGTKMPRANADFIMNMLIPVPRATEQQQIADYLDKKCAEIDELIAIKQQKIEALKEYKKSVIFEYVTGKKEVL